MQTAAAAHEQIAMQMHQQHLRQTEMRQAEMRQADIDVLRRQHRFLQVNIANDF